MNGSVFSMEPFLVSADWESSLWGESYPVRNDLIPVGFSQTDEVHLISADTQQQNTQLSDTAQQGICFDKNIRLNIFHFSCLKIRIWSFYQVSLRFIFDLKLIQVLF